MPGFDPDQPRDKNGQWTAGDANTAIKSAASDRPNVKRVTNEKDAAQAIQDFEKEKLTKEMERAIQLYTDGSYYDLNKWLRGVPGFENPPPNGPEIVSGLEKFLNEAPKYEGDVYRGIKFSSSVAFNSFKSKLSPGNIIEDNGFVSTTTELSNVSTFSISRADPYAVNMVIKSKNGVFIDPLSSFKGEKEVMFNRRTKFKVNDVEEKPFKTPAYGDVTGKLLTVELEEL